MDRFNPGPIDTSVLILQADHRSEFIWANPDDRVVNILETRRSGATLHRTHPSLDARMIPYLRQAGFYGVAMIGFSRIHNALITALVERWRPETHTFHLPDGECTITLEDVEILFHLRVNGIPVIGQQYGDWPDICEAILGQRPPEDMILGNRLKMSWLNQTFSFIPEDATEEVIEQHTKAYIMKLFAGILFPSKKTDVVSLWLLPFLLDLQVCGQYSWGSAVLAHCYRGLCNGARADTQQISGCMMLVQFWAYERIPRLRPDFVGYPSRCFAAIHRDVADAPRAYMWAQSINRAAIEGTTTSSFRLVLDSLAPNQFIWRPYVAIAPGEGHVIYRTVVPLIGFSIVEWHQADRVMRQFGMRQHIPSPPLQDLSLHDIDTRRKIGGDWVGYYQVFIDVWNSRENSTVPGVQDTTDGSLPYQSQYMIWYRRITRRWMTRQGALIALDVDEVRNRIPGILQAPPTPVTQARPIWEDGRRRGRGRGRGRGRDRGRGHARGDEGHGEDGHGRGRAHDQQGAISFPMQTFTSVGAGPSNQVGSQSFNPIGGPFNPIAGPSNFGVGQPFYGSQSSFSDAGPSNFGVGQPFFDDGSSNFGVGQPFSDVGPSTFGVGQPFSDAGPSTFGVGHSSFYTPNLPTTAHFPSYGFAPYQPHVRPHVFQPTPIPFSLGDESFTEMVGMPHSQSYTPLAQNLEPEPSSSDMSLDSSNQEDLDIRAPYDFRPNRHQGRTCGTGSHYFGYPHQ